MLAVSERGGGMFGLNDSNSNNNGSDANTADASTDSGLSIDTAPPAPVNQPPEEPPAASPAPVPTTDNVTPVPAPDNTPPAAPTSTPAEPPAPAADNPAPATEPAKDNSAASVSSDASLRSLNLENAYIPTDPPQNDPLSGSSAPSSDAPTAASLTNNANEDELIKLKQQALQSLAPLVDHLDQSAEEKFKTTMMLIQASDNADLIPEAYEAAGKIEDEKVRAQALLDVVNEINYFTQHQQNNS